MKKKARASLARRFNAALVQFDPAYAGQFVCPTCLRRYPVDALGDITEAHVIPQSAGGKLSTLNCRQCNSGAGGRQDKWFGEYLYLRSGNRSLLATRHQTGTFNIDEVRVSGEFRVGPDGASEFYIWQNRTSPAALRRLFEKVASRDVKGHSFHVPLLANRKLVDVGALTSAYLLWFRALGYSWSLQSQLAPVRALIKDPASPLAARTFAAHLPGGFFDEPWIGIGKVAGELALLAAIGDHVVFFPPADSVDFYSKMPKDLRGAEFEDGRALRFDVRHAFEGPIGVLYEGRHIIVPDVLRELGKVKDPSFLHFSADGSVAMLASITEEQARELKDQDVKRVKMTMPQRGQLTPP